MPKIDPSLHREKKPPWIRVKLPNDPVFFNTKDLIDDLRLVTVCEEASDRRQQGGAELQYLNHCGISRLRHSALSL